MKRWLFILIVTALNITGAHLYACDPPAGDPWFISAYTFDQLNLPPDLEFVYDFSPKYVPYAVRNKGRVPFYIVAEKSIYDTNDYTYSEVPDGYKPIYKMVSNKVYYWDHSAKNGQGRWEANDGGVNNHAASMVAIDDKLMNTLGFETKHVNGDNRPEGTSPPTSQSVQIPLFYDGKLMSINATVHYKLNPDYVPDRTANGIEDCVP